MNGNICLDPLFCDPDGGDFGLQEDSPCRGHAPESPDCDRMGAWPVGCFTGGAAAWPTAPRSGIRVVPNPSPGACRIFYTIGKPGAPEVSVFDAAGRMVDRTDRGWSAPGEYSFFWNGRDESGQELHSGVYLVRMTGGGETITGRLILLR